MQLYGKPHISEMINFKNVYIWLNIVCLIG